MAFLGPLISALIVPAATAAIGVGISEALRDDPDIPSAQAPPGRTSAEVVAAADAERRKRAAAFGRAKTLLTPRSTLGVPLPSPGQKGLLGT